MLRCQIKCQKSFSIARIECDSTNRKGPGVSHWFLFFTDEVFDYNHYNYNNYQGFGCFSVIRFVDDFNFFWRMDVH